MADENKIKGAEAKQGAITPADIIAATPAPKRLRVSGFSGSYRGVVFNGGVSETPVPKEIADELAQQFPNATIEEVADEPEKAEKAKK
jgi:hypothetical protein